MIQIANLDDGREVLVSDERFETFSLNVEGEENPVKFAVVLTSEMKQHLINQAKAEQREACHKAVLVAASYGIDGDVDDMIGVGNASEAILNATEDK